MEEKDLEKYTLAVCEIARQAGAYIREERRKFSLESVERKHAHDYVSYVDKGSERLIVSALRELLPEAGFITEEGTAREVRSEECGVRSEELLWVVDPLDGTTNFIHQYAPYAVSIALLQGKTVLIGVVYEICADECFYAWKGGGAWLCGMRNVECGTRSEECGMRNVECGMRSEKLRVSSQKMQDALLCLQFPYNSDAYKPVMKRLIDRLYCQVAAGRLDGYAEQYIGQWDYMAGSLIVMEAGGTVTDYSGSPDFTQGNSVVATNGVIQQDFLSVIKAE